jgi:hypothetical protein
MFRQEGRGRLKTIAGEILKIRSLMEELVETVDEPIQSDRRPSS